MNEASHFNKYISQMLVFVHRLFCSWRVLAYTFISCCLLIVISACTPVDINVERIKLGDWSVNDARFSQAGMLALSVSQDIGIYNNNGELEHLVSMPVPNGIWQMSWQTNHHLWLYDQYSLYHWRVGALEVVALESFRNDAIRQVRVSPKGLMLTTESGSVLWYGITDENKLQQPRVLLDALVGISTVGFTLHQQPYVATKSGDLWLWDDTSYTTVQHFKINQPIHEVVQIEQQLFALSSRYNNPLATDNELTLWQLNSHSPPQAYKFSEQTGVFSHLVVNNTLIIGGSNSTWQSFNIHTLKQNSGALTTRNPNQQGRIIALYELPTVILMLNSRGEMQKWQKTRIFGNGH